MLQKLRSDQYPHFRHHAVGWGCAFLLLGLNLYIAFDLFTVEYTRSLHSIEGNFIALSRFMMEHPFERLWWPLWDGGMPFQHTYFPLLPMTVAFVAKTAGFSAAFSYHVVIGAVYCLGPVTLFLMAWGLSGLRGPSFSAALAYSLLSPSAFLIPEISRDAGGLWNPQRLRVLAYYGGAPQIAALTLLPLAILFLHLSFKHRRPWFYLPAGALMAAVVLTNAFGAAVLAMAVLCLLAVQEARSLRKNILLAVTISLLSYLWISPWMPPSLLGTILSNSSTAGGDFRWSGRSWLGVMIVATLWAILWSIAQRKIQTKHVRFFTLFGFLVSSIPLVGYGAGLHVLPQPHRYHLEMEMALCIVAVFALWPIVKRLPEDARFICVAFLLLLAARQAVQYHRYTENLVQPIDITQTIEYKTANWMKEHFGNRRVMVSGSCSFWFNVFTDTPQIGGGHDTTTPNPVQKIALFTIYTGENAGDRDGEISVLWLKAFGAHAVQVTGPDSGEHYKPFRNPRKFDGLLPVLRRKGGETVYRVPQRSELGAYIVPANAVVDQEPIHGLDTEQLERYVAALEDPSLPLADVDGRNFHSARIRAIMQPGQVVSMQINYHPGWRATVRGIQQSIFRDGLGLLVIKPDCQGPCEIDLVYDGGLELKVTRLLSFAVLVSVLGGYSALLFRKSRRRG